MNISSITQIIQKGINMSNALKNKKFNTWISPEDLDYVNKFCKRNKVYRSAYMRDVSIICIRYNILPNELEEILHIYTEKNL